MKLNYKYFINPIAKFDDKVLFIIGILCTILFSFIAGILKVVFDGVLDIHLYDKSSFLLNLSMNTINVLCEFVLTYILAKFIYEKTRFIDVLNAVLIARIPIYLGSFLVGNSLMDDFGKEVMASLENGNLHFDPIQMILVLIISMILIVFMVYHFVVLFNGFRTASNSKKGMHIVLFIVAIILAEVISKIIISKII